MPTLDVEDGLIPGVGPPDEVVHAFFRRFLPDFYFVNAPVSRMRRHLELLRKLPQQPVIIDFYRPSGAHFTELTLCAHDDAQPGLLSKVAGALVALKINVHTAWIHTLTDPHDVKNGRRVVLDTLILSEPYFGRSRPLSAKTQARVSETLTQLLAGNRSLSQLFMQVKRKPQAPLVVYDLSASKTNDGFTLIKLRAADHSGVLYRITRALAALQLDVAHAQINTFEKAVDDVFFVSRNRAALFDADAAQVIDELRQSLEHHSSAENFGD